MRNLMLIGGPSHPFRETAPRVSAILAEAGFVTDVYEDIETGLRELARDAHRMLTVHCLRWSMSQSAKYAPLRDQWALSLSDVGRKAIEAHLQGGGGLLGLHTASISFDDWPAWRAHLGAAWKWDRSSHPPCGPLLVTIDDKDHPITRGVMDFECEDELYSDLSIDPAAKILAHARIGQGGLQPVVFAHETVAGRAAYLALGHGPTSFEVPAHAQMVRQAARWCAQA